MKPLRVAELVEFGGSCGCPLHCDGIRDFAGTGQSKLNTGVLLPVALVVRDRHQTNLLGINRKLIRHQQKTY